MACLTLRKGKAALGQVDVVWMLGKGSKVDDWELRMSLRSFWQHYRTTACLWIIGHIPAWIDQAQIRCIPWPDPFRNSKDANLIGKALRMAMEPDLSDLFILCSDDHFLLRESGAQDFGWWHGNEIKPARNGQTKWQRRLAMTGEKLRAAGFPALCYEEHIPYPVRREWCAGALRVPYAYDGGMTIFSTLLNVAGVKGQFVGSEHIRGDLRGANVKAETIEWKTSVNQFACIDSDSLKNPALVSRLESLFPSPAPWEKAPHALPWTFGDKGSLPVEPHSTSARPVVAPPPSSPVRSRPSQEREPLPLTGVEIPAALAKVISKLGHTIPIGRTMLYHTQGGEAFTVARTEAGLTVSVSDTKPSIGPQQPREPHWGPPVWKYLHASMREMATEDERRAVVGHLELRIRCAECQQHWSEFLVTLPPRLDTNESAFAWSVEIHNAFRRMLEQTEMPLDEADRLYPKPMFERPTPMMFEWPAEKPNVPPDDHGWFDERSIAELNPLVRPDMTCIVEVGSWLGKSLRWFAGRCPGARLYAVDTWQGRGIERESRKKIIAKLPTCFETFLVNCWHLRDRLTPVRMPSVEGLTRLHAAGVKPDLIYIDADHSEEACRNDVLAAARLFPDAIIIGDDWTFASVRAGVRSAVETLGPRYTVESSGRCWKLVCSQT